MAAIFIRRAVVTLFNSVGLLGVPIGQFFRGHGHVLRLLVAIRWKAVVVELGGVGGQLGSMSCCEVARLRAS